MASVATRVGTLFSIVEGVDAPPTPQVALAIADAVKDAGALHESWQTILSLDIPALNQQLRSAGLAPIEAGHGR